MAYSPAPLALDRSKPGPWNVDAAFVSPEHQKLWRDLKVVIPFWDSTHGRHDGAWKMGAVTSAPQLVPKTWGQAIDFDESDDHVEWSSGDVGDAWAVGANDPFTIACVLHTDTDMSGSNFEYFLSIGGFEAAGSFNFYITEGASHELTVAMSSATQENSDSLDVDRSYVCAFRRVSDGTGDITVNGTGRLNTGAYGGASISASLPVNVGRRSDGNVDRFFGGAMYAVYKWDRALTDKELLLLSADPFGLLRPNWDYATGAAFDPANLQATVDGSDVTLTWDASF